MAPSSARSAEGESDERKDSMTAMPVSVRKCLQQAHISELQPVRWRYAKEKSPKFILACAGSVVKRRCEGVAGNLDQGTGAIRLICYNPHGSQETRQNCLMKA